MAFKEGIAGQRPIVNGLSRLAVRDAAAASA